MVEEMDQRFEKILSSNKDVVGGLVMNEEGAIIKTSMDNKNAEKYANAVHEIVKTARTLFREVDPNDDITFIRFSLKKFNVMIAPEKSFLLIIITNQES